MTLLRIGHLLDNHLKTHRPNMVRHLQKRGVYQQYLVETQERASEALVDLISRRGATYHQAWEIVTTEMIFLPDEKEVPVHPRIRCLTVSQEKGLRKGNDPDYLSVDLIIREKVRGFMAVLAECPRCRRKQSVKNKNCKGCEINLDNAKKSKRVRYWIDFKLPGGQQKRELIGKSIEKARDADGKRRGQKREGRLDEIFDHKKESTWTFKQLAEWWLKLDAVKARSDHGRLKIAFARFNEVFGDRFIRDVKVSELRGYQAKRLSEGRAKSTTDHETHSAAKAAMRAAWMDNEITKKTWKTWESFKKLISGKKAKKKYARDRVLEIEEYCRLRPHLPSHVQVLVDVSLFTGMRKSELVPDNTNGRGTSGLLWSQVDYKDNNIRLTDTKTDTPRDIPVTDKLKEMLKAIPRTLGDDNVFTYRGKPFSDVRTGLIKACEDAGITYGKKVEGGFVFGDLRRTAKTLMARAGIDKAYRDSILGHEPQDMDRHYLHPSEKDLRFAMEKYHTWLTEQIEVGQEKLKAEGNTG